MYASSSSVYGGNKKVPFSTDDKVDNPVSLYAATKKSNELMAHAYSKLYNIPSSGLRFFTVYGPAGRPDMAYFGFTNKLLKGETIQIFNYGNCKRDFTYIDNAVQANLLAAVAPRPARSRVYNMAVGERSTLKGLFSAIRRALMENRVVYDREPVYREFRPGDVRHSLADIGAARDQLGYAPTHDLAAGLAEAMPWYVRHLG